MTKHCKVTKPYIKATPKISIVGFPMCIPTNALWCKKARSVQYLQDGIGPNILLMLFLRYNFKSGNFFLLLMMHHGDSSKRM